MSDEKALGLGEKIAGLESELSKTIVSFKKSLPMTDPGSKVAAHAGLALKSLLEAEGALTSARHALDDHASHTNRLAAAVEESKKEKP